MGQRAIPVVRFTDSPDVTISQIRSALETYGFFQLIDHDLPKDLLESVFASSRQYFTLPTPVKREALKTDHIAGGYEAYSSYSLDAAEGKPDLNEGFCIAPTHVDGTSQWPSETDMPNFKSLCRTYYAEANRISRKLGGYIALGLELKENFFDSYFHEQMAHCRLIHYHASDDSLASGNLGIGAHTDWGLITVLVQDNVGGLEVFDTASNTFLPVPPTPGAIIVNSGDLLTLMTNNKYHSARHRVAAPKPGKDRYSVVFFSDGNPEYEVDVLPGVLQVGEKSKVKATTAGKYFQMKWEESRGISAGGNA